MEKDDKLLIISKIVDKAINVVLDGAEDITKNSDTPEDLKYKFFCEMLMSFFVSFSGTFVSSLCNYMEKDKVKMYKMLSDIIIGALENNVREDVAKINWREIFSEDKKDNLH